MNDCAVLVKDVFKSYGNNTILKNLCMKVETGQIYGLLGASGCGKTTLLNTIVGRKKVDSGEVWVLAEKQGVPNSSPLGKKIGYMPQETSLVREFTVKDAIFYFGRIFHMKEKMIQQRFRELSDLLNLPPENRFLKDCSGGEQRRVSFAVALVHVPQLLILDEPTVGIDPLLREKIWSYIVEITRKKSISVIITTHYIEECKQADKIGLMREGTLLTEEHPNKLLSLYGTNTLEEVFLLLCKKQIDEQSTTEKFNFSEANVYLQNHFELSTSSQSLPDSYKSTDVLTKPGKANFHIMNKWRMKALLDKNSKQFYRNITAVVFLLGMPVIQTLMMLYSVGLDMKSISIGIVNDESMSAFCPNFTIQKTIRYEDKESYCHFNNLSCRFLQLLDNNPKLTKVQYNTLEDAYTGVVHGKITALLYFPKNFSNSLEHRLNEGLRAETYTLEYGQVKVRMDMSNYQMGLSVKTELINIYLKFQRALLTECKFLSRVVELPVHMQFIFGSKEDSFQVFIIPGTIMTMMFFFGSIMTSQIMVTEKYEGIWGRSMVAGVTTLELTVSHLFFQGLLAIFQALEMVVLIYGVFEFEYIGNLWLMYFLVYLQGLCGMSYGMLVSTVSTSITMTNNAVMGFFLPVIVVSGTLWPRQGMPNYLQIVANIMPCSLPTEALRSVTRKGSNIIDFEVVSGVLVLLLWIVTFSLISLFFIKRQK